MAIQTLLWIIAALLLGIFLQLDAIRGRLKERFPTEKEEDAKWAQADPMGHWEAHKKEQSAKK